MHCEGLRVTFVLLCVCVLICVVFVCLCVFDCVCFCVIVCLCVSVFVYVFVCVCMRAVLPFVSYVLCVVCVMLCCVVACCTVLWHVSCLRGFGVHLTQRKYGTLRSLLRELLLCSMQTVCFSIFLMTRGCKWTTSLANSSGITEWLPGFAFHLTHP